jgi:hypothetical protein
LINLVLLIVLISIIVLPLSQYFEAMMRFQRLPRGAFLVPLIVFSTVSLLSILFGLTVGLRSLRRDF